MMITEAEAKMKWCPYVRSQAHEDAPPGNSDAVQRNPTYSRCIGSECMKWEWVNMNQTKGRCYNW